jgi:hypothetical protein
MQSLAKLMEDAVRELGVLSATRRKRDEARSYFEKARVGAERQGTDKLLQKIDVAFAEFQQRPVRPSLRPLPTFATFRRSVAMGALRPTPGRPRRKDGPKSALADIAGSAALEGRLRRHDGR